MGQAIETLIRPDDQVVILQREHDTGLWDRRPTTAEAIRVLTRGYKAVVLLDVADVSAERVEEEKWIRTRLKGTIVDVVRSRGLPLAKGQPLQVVTAGGEMMIGHVLVRANYARRIPAGRRYLVFVESLPSDDPSFGVLISGLPRAPGIPANPSYRRKH